MSEGRLILASASPRRKELLGQLGLPFEIVVADVVEHEDPATDPRIMVASNAALKAEWVAERHPEAFVLGADTTVFIEGRALNKPADSAEAREMLRALSGRTHTVFTGVSLRHRRSGLRYDVGVASDVTFQVLTDEVIAAYLAKVHTLDKAGGYAIQESPDLLIARREGSLSNIIGLPLDETKQILTKAGLLD